MVAVAVGILAQCLLTGESAAYQIDVINEMAK
jgi:hypothetical protein